MSRNAEYDQALKNLESVLTAPDRLSGFGDVPKEEILSRALTITNRMLQIYEAKDTDYSDNDLPMGNLRESTEWGIQPWRAVMIRLGDKKRRIASFVKRGQYQVPDENVDDTLLDFANYCMFGVVLYSEAVKTYLSDIELRWKPESRTEFEQKAWQVRDLMYSMAAAAIHSKILYEFQTVTSTRRDIKVPPTLKWYEEPWQMLNAQYNNISQFATHVGRHL